MLVGVSEWGAETFESVKNSGGTYIGKNSCGTCIGTCIGTHHLAQNNLAASVKALKKNVHFSVWAQHLLAIER